MGPATSFGAAATTAATTAANRLLFELDAASAHLNGPARLMMGATAQGFQRPRTLEGAPAMFDASWTHTRA